MTTVVQFMKENVFVFVKKSDQQGQVLRKKYENLQKNYQGKNVHLELF